jgi:hypothetical protein
MFLLAALMVTPAYATTLRGIIDELTNAAKNVVQGLIFLCFIVGLGLYVIPLPWEEWSARGKALMVRACTAQVVYALASLIFTWLASLG